MMRENMGLYRGKRIDNGKWIRGFYAHFIDLHKERETHRIYRLFAESDCGDFYPDYYEVDPDTIGEHTGLEDKYGNLIFEGDIVAQSWYDHDEPITDVFGEVIYCINDCSFSVLNLEKKVMEALGRANAFAWEIEVCGNIHDNPELLKGGEGE